MDKISNRQSICNTLLNAAIKDKDIFVVCSDSRGSGSMTEFANQYPEQFIELGIAEQNLVSVSAGLASCGKKVFAVSPASFLSTRSYEQAKVDVAYACTDVTLIGISGGISYGALGMTHHSLQDIAAFCSLPGMRVYIPSDRFQTQAVINEVLQDRLPSYIRVSRGVSEDLYNESTAFTDGVCVLKEGQDVLLIACGEMTVRAVEAAELLEKNGISVGVLDVYRIKPINEKIIVKYAESVKAVVTIEEHSPYGGLGSIVAQIIGRNCPKKTVNLSLPDGHIIAGTAEEAFDYYGLSAEGIFNSVKGALQ